MLRFAGSGRYLSLQASVCGWGFNYACALSPTDLNLIHPKLGNKCLRPTQYRYSASFLVAMPRLPGRWPNVAKTSFRAL